MGGTVRYIAQRRWRGLSVLQVLRPGKAFITRDFSVLYAPASCCCTRFSVAQGAVWQRQRLPDGSLSLLERARGGKVLLGSLLCYLWLQRVLRSRLIFCVMSLTAQGAHRGRPVAAAPCTPGLRPAKSPLRGPFDLSLQASGRAEAASVQNTALSPHPCGLPRPSGNVSAILRPSAPAVSVAQVGKSMTGCTNPPGRVRRSRHPAKIRHKRGTNTAQQRSRDKGVTHRYPGFSLLARCAAASVLISRCRRND